MGVSFITLMEILTNPTDLQVAITKSIKGKFGYLICRGPRHSYKQLLEARASEGSLEGVLASLKTFFDGVIALNKSDVQVDVLNALHVAKIIDELRKHQIANTHEMQLVG